MSLKEMFLNRYLSNEKIEEGYYIRIRRNRKNTEENIKVYYVGFKIFDLTINKTNSGDKEELIVNPQIFIPNSKNVYEGDKLISDYENIPARVKKDADVMEDYFDMEIGTGKDSNCKLNFELASEAKKMTKEELDMYVESVVDKEFNTDINIKKEFISVEKGNRKEPEKKEYKVIMTLNNKKINFEELYKLRLKLLEEVIYKLVKPYIDKDGKMKYNRYFQNVNLNLKFKLNKEINEDDLERIEKALVYRTIIYAGLDGKEEDILDYKNTKSPNNQEKQKQQDFMVMFNNKNRLDIMYKTKDGYEKCLYSKDVKPFELEYIIYAGIDKSLEEDKGFKDDDSDKQARENVKGRIDNTLVNGNEALFVEIKYGDEVIDKSNGIHKHLVDIYSCLNMNKDGILKSYGHRVNERNEIILNKKLDETEKVKINKIRYDIVCIYKSDASEEDKGLSRDDVLRKIDSIYYKDCFGAKMIRNIDDNKKKEEIEEENKIKVCSGHKDNNTICKDANNYCRNLLSKNVPELIDMIDTKGCEVKIILVDDKFNKFEEYVPKENVSI